MPQRTDHSKQADPNARFASNVSDSTFGQPEKLAALHAEAERRRIAHLPTHHADPDAKVAKNIADATFGGQTGTIEELPDHTKPDPTTVAHVQVLDPVTGR